MVHLSYLLVQNLSAKFKNRLLFNSLTPFKILFTYKKRASEQIFNHCTAVYQRYAGQRAKFAKKVHKPPLRVHVINFKLNRFITPIWIPWNPQTPKIKYLIRNKCIFAPIQAFQWKLFWRRLKLWVSKWNAEDMYKVQKLA